MIECRIVDQGVAPAELTLRGSYERVDVLGPTDIAGHAHNAPRCLREFGDQLFEEFVASGCGYDTGAAPRECRSSSSPKSRTGPGDDRGAAQERNVVAHPTHILPLPSPRRLC